MTEQEIQQKLARLEQLEKANRKRLDKAKAASKRRHEAKKQAGLKRISLYVNTEIYKDMQAKGYTVMSVVWVNKKDFNERTFESFQKKNFRVYAYINDKNNWDVRWLNRDGD